MCDLEDIGVTFILRLIRSAATLVRILPTLDLSCEENLFWCRLLGRRAGTPARDKSADSICRCVNEVQGHVTCLG